MLELLGKFLINLKFIGVALAQNSQSGGNSQNSYNSQSGSGGIKLTNPLTCPDITCVVGAITKALLDISIPIVAIMVLVGGFQILTAGGDPEKFKTGRKTIMYAVIGFAVILIANGVVSIVQSLLTP